MKICFIVTLEVNMYNILVCDDDKDIVSALKIYLSAEGYNVFEAYNGKEAVTFVDREDVHLVLLDVMMPKMDGIEAISEIRKLSNVPVILLTAKSEDTDKILGLNMGADDYVTKPFNPVEVMARVRSNIRRYIHLGGGEIKPTRIVIGGITLDDAEKNVYLDGDIIQLTPREYDILRLFMQNPGTVFSPKEIYRKVWGELPINAENAVAVHIRHLREKIEINPADPRYIKVVWGQGYKIDRGA
jgi:DNA-binding response OmpR family regulator